jgi:alpha-ribazole phosphatase
LAKIILVRHGETEKNSSERYWGRTDVELGAKGLRQAEQLRDRLKTEKINIVYSSNLRRALVTARTIAVTHQLEVEVCPELQEIDFGEIEGLNFAEVTEQHPEVAQQWMAQSPDLTYPGGERVPDMESRVAGFKKKLEKHDENETILIVAHSGILRTLICQLLGWEPERRWQIRVDLASVSTVYIYPESAILTQLNDVCHLEQGD